MPQSLVPGGGEGGQGSAVAYAKAKALREGPHHVSSRITAIRFRSNCKVAQDDRTAGGHQPAEKKRTIASCRIAGDIRKPWAL